MNDVRAVQQQLSARLLARSSASSRLLLSHAAETASTGHQQATSAAAARVGSRASRTVYALTPAAVASRRVDDTVHVRTRRSIDAHLLHGADRGRVNRTPGTVYTSRAACVGGAGPDSERALVALIYVASNSTRQRPSPRR